MNTPAARHAPKGAAPANSLLLVSAAAAAASLVPVLAYQTGLLRHLPDPPGAIFDSDRIADSKAAHPFGVPDAALGIASYSATIALIVMAPRYPAARRLLPFKLLADGGLAAFDFTRQIVRFGKICSWCSATALCTATALVAGRGLIAGEARTLLRTAGTDVPGSLVEESGSFEASGSFIEGWRGGRGGLRYRSINETLPVARS